MRLIWVYGADPHRFCAHVWPGRAVWSRDIDQGCDAAILRVLTAKTATHPPRVLRTTLRGYPGYPKAYGRAVRQPPWVLHGGWGTWQRQQPWLQYCPHCLQEDADPYFRRRWRLAFVTICPAHRQQLLDRCAVCSAVVNFHCLAPDAVALTLCHHCQSDLRVAHAPALAPSNASRRLLWVQTSLLVAMQCGWCYLTGGRPVRTMTYLQALHRLSRFLLTVQAPPCTDRRCPQSYNTCFSPRVFLRLPGKRLKDSLWWTVCGSCSWWPRGSPSGRHRSCSPGLRPPAAEAIPSQRRSRV
jgi:hypothetical protein